MPVTRFDVRLRRPLAGGAPFGPAGPYEELKGTLHFSLDPKHGANVRITDVALAPRNHSGRVELESDVSVSLTADRGLGCRRAVLALVVQVDIVSDHNF